MGDGCGGAGLDALVHGPLNVGGNGEQTFSGLRVRPRLAVVGSAMHTFPVVVAALASRMGIVEARNPKMKIVARRRMLSVVFK